MGHTPYSGLYWKDKFDDDFGSGEWDSWSIGIIILEIILGSDVVTNIKTYDQVDDILVLFTEYIDKDLLSLIKDLLDGIS